MRLKPTACYIRVSTQEQKLHGISLDAQREKLAEYAKAHDLHIIEWYADEGISGKKPIAKRPALQRMIADAEKGKFEHIIFIKLDRFFRSVAEYHECMKRLGDVTWDATEEKYDISTANGRAFVNMKLTIAELEADQTGERIRLVNEYKVKTGQPLSGSMPWSHKIVKTDNGKSVVVNEENREHCLEVLDFFLKTGAMRQAMFLCSKYHEFHDLKGFKKWLTNPMLYGAYKGNEAYCEPLIAKEKFDKIQSLISTSTRKYKHTYLFSGMIHCPVCGKVMTGYYAMQTVNGTTYRYKKYKCDGYARNKRCSYSFHLSQNKIEECLLEHLEEFTTIDPPPKLKLKKKPKVDADKIRKEMDRLNYMFQKNRIPLAEYDAQYLALQNALQETPPDESDEEKLKEIQELLNSGWKNAYNALDEEHKKIFWHSTIKRIDVTKNGRHYTIHNIEFI